MGLIIKEKNHRYNIKSSVSNEQLHDKKWISENDVKILLIERLYIRFIEDSVKAYFDFPDRYMINSKIGKSNRKYYEFLEKNKYSTKSIVKKFNEIIDKLKIDLKW